jgi:hypothetical protein
MIHLFHQFRPKQASLGLHYFVAVSDTHMAIKVSRQEALGADKAAERWLRHVIKEGKCCTDLLPSDVSCVI